MLKWRARLFLAFFCVSFCGQLSAATSLQQCIAGAAEFHQVNSSVLMAIINHESRQIAGTITRNTDGSADYGLTGINSIHLDELRRHGISSGHLLNECISVYVGAWMYSRKVAVYGNTWKAIGAYHSKTPYYNERYQALIYNEMIRLGLLDGLPIRVPPMPARQTRQQ